MKLDDNPLTNRQSPLHGFRDYLDGLLASRQTAQPMSHRMFDFVVGFQRHSQSVVSLLNQLISRQLRSAVEPDGASPKGC